MTIFLILGGLVLLLFTGVPTFAGLAVFSGGLMWLTQGDLGAITEVIFNDLNNYMLVAIPLFAFMAHIMIKGKIVDDLYGTAYTLTRHLPGGVGIATIAACTVFAAISGSSVATAMTIGAVAIPQMIRFGYSPKTAYGLVAAGGTLGILIPPSGPMILYGVVANASIGGLFAAGMIPGILLALLFAGWCMIETSFGRSAVQREARASIAEITLALKKSFWAMLLPIMVLGGMYAGIFTATEAAAVGALLALIIAAIVYRNVGFKDVWEAALGGARTSAMLFMIMAGAIVFGHVLTKMRIPQELVALATSVDLGIFGFLAVVMGLIFILGMFLESISIILITTPVVLPVMHAMGINPIWYGVLLVINLELAMITPPVGMNLFTIKAITNAPMKTIISGGVPYIWLMIAGLIAIMAIPSIALWLPRIMLGV